MRGQIYKIYSDSYFVKSGDNLIVCKIREVLKKSKTSVITGDFVIYENDVITEILPRKSFIKRPAVANISQMLVVSALKQPELDFHQLNRYCAFAKYYKIPAILCFNKEDLGLDDSLQNKIIDIYSNLGYKILFTSAAQKIGIENLAQALSGKTTALCGNSGVGKSSLINALNPSINLRTKAVSEKSERGTHTTRHSEIIELNQNSKIIDTPGFSNLRFDFLLPKDVDDLFDDISKYAKDCKYSDCLHIHEDGCAVLKHIEKIDKTRYESYLEFVNEAFENKEKVKYNGTKTESRQKFRNNRQVAKISEKKRQSSRNTFKQKLYKELDENENE